MSFSNPLLAGSLNLFFRAANRLSSGKNNHISLFCILIINIIIIISISISILLCHLIKLSLSQPMSFPFYPFLPPIPLDGGRGGVSERLSGPNHQLPG